MREVASIHECWSATTTSVRKPSSKGIPDGSAMVEERIVEGSLVDRPLEREGVKIEMRRRMRGTAETKRSRKR